MAHAARSHSRARYRRYAPGSTLGLGETSGGPQFGYAAQPQEPLGYASQFTGVTSSLGSIASKADLKASNRRHIS